MTNGAIWRTVRMSRWPDECPTLGMIPIELIEEWKDEVRDKISDSYSTIFEAADKLHELYDHADTDEPEKTADELDSSIDDLIAQRDYLREKQTELDNLTQ